MTDVFRTFLVPTEHVELARAVAAGADPVGGTGMFVSALSADGDPPATYYISSGLLPPVIADAFYSAPAAYAANFAGDYPVSATLQDCADMLAVMDISEDPPGTVLERVHVQAVVED